MNMYQNNVSEAFSPDIFDVVRNKYDNDWGKYADYVYSKTKLLDADNSVCFPVKSSYRSSISIGSETVISFISFQPIGSAFSLDFTHCLLF